MNYDKQLPLTKDEIDYINSKNNLCVCDINSYPKGFIHTQIAWSLPIKISRNEDCFYFNCGINEKTNKENYWVVSTNKQAEQSFKFEIRQFKSIDKALEYAIRNYKNWLKSRMEFLTSIN